MMQRWTIPLSLATMIFPKRGRRNAGFSLIANEKGGRARRHRPPIASPSRWINQRRAPRMAADWGTRVNPNLPPNRLAWTK
jgi:hypothetical protein